MKRPFDITLSALGLLILSPLFLALALAIKLTSPGPVFYRGVRMGKDWKPFRIFKFRSMVADAERAGGPDTRERDPRVTAVGRFMRKWKLDELPQLLNILQGDMSLVGPRPEVPDRAELSTAEERLVYTILPGITDYASLWNAHEEERLAAAKNTEEAERIYLTEIRPEKVRLQLKYFRERSLTTDAKILFLTVRKILFKS